MVNIGDNVKVGDVITGLYGEMEVGIIGNRVEDAFSEMYPHPELPLMHTMAGPWQTCVLQLLNFGFPYIDAVTELDLRRITVSVYLKPEWKKLKPSVEGWLYRVLSPSRVYRPLTWVN